MPSAKRARPGLAGLGISSVLIIVLALGGAFVESYEYQYVSTQLEKIASANISALVQKNRIGEARLVILNRDGHAQPGERVLVDSASPDFILGAGIWTTTASASWTRSDWKLYTDVGFEYEQVWTTWRLIEPERLGFDFSSVQGQLDYVRSNAPNVKFFARFQGVVLDPLVGPSLGDSSPPDFTGFSTKIPSDRSSYLSDLKTYVRALVARYKDDIKLWITPIEINRIDYAISAFNLTDQPWALRDAIEIDRVIAQTIRESDPEAKIALGTSTPLSLFERAGVTRVDPIQFERLAIDGGVPFDMVAIETYGFSGDVFYWAQYLRTMAGLGYPIFINEAGYSSRTADQALDSGAHEQSSWYRMMLGLSLGMKQVAGFWILHFKDRELQQRYKEFEGMGLLDADGRPKESYYSLHGLLQNLTRPDNLLCSPEGEVTLRVLAGNYTISAFNATAEIHVVEGETLFYTIQATGQSHLQIVTVESKVTQS